MFSAMPSHAAHMRHAFYCSWTRTTISEHFTITQSNTLRSFKHEYKNN